MWKRGKKERRTDSSVEVKYDYFPSLFGLGTESPSHGLVVPGAETVVPIVDGGVSAGSEPAKRASTVTTGTGAGHREQDTRRVPPHARRLRAFGAYMHDLPRRWGLIFS